MIRLTDLELVPLPHSRGQELERAAEMIFQRGDKCTKRPWKLLGYGCLAVTALVAVGTVTVALAAPLLGVASVVAIVPLTLSLTLLSYLSGALMGHADRQERKDL